MLLLQASTSSSDTKDIIMSTYVSVSVSASLNRMEPLKPSGHRQQQVTLDTSSHMQLLLVTHRTKLCATTHSHSTITATSNHPQTLNPSSHGEPQATTPQAATGTHKQSLTASSHEYRWQPLEPHSFDDPAHDDSCLLLFGESCTVWSSLSMACKDWQSLVRPP